MGRRAGLAVLALSLGMTGAAPARAEVETFKGEYTVSFLGFTIARSTFESRFEGEKFSVEGSVSSAGIAEIFDSTKGKGSASGGFAGDRTQPSAFRMDYSEGKRKQMTALKFRGGTVVSTENLPPLKKRKNWVPVRSGDLKGVTDPLSAGIVKAASPDKVCGRTIKLFDGEFRMDATLHPAPNSEAAKAYGDDVVTCRVTVKPVSGYRKGRKSLDYLEKQSRIMIAFAPLGSTGVYAPVHATVGTEIGTVTVRAKRIDTKK
ncbi:DUF3108 domain-containing protein [Mesorhizobium sp. LHD-90]|uniref:DUF3108 domain-containing protein n=1 Tax=Mesorhizobium sp. LHD-90 TaxID=3071414 RepID=UPI0027DEB8B7|nr:DUF3108 domain-containing protein [Mesorhizobium sp. LHD-90]MDQ6432636.1 DUF3108 domain-containing protein [Mesorhizobium sp. LHD-90]